MSGIFAFSEGHEMQSYLYKTATPTARNLVALSFEPSQNVSSLEMLASEAFAVAGEDCLVVPDLFASWEDARESRTLPLHVSVAFELISGTDVVWLREFIQQVTLSAINEFDLPAIIGDPSRGSRSDFPWNWSMESILERLAELEEMLAGHIRTTRLGRNEHELSIRRAIGVLEASSRLLNARAQPTVAPAIAGALQKCIPHEWMSRHAADLNGSTRSSAPQRRHVPPIAVRTGRGPSLRGDRELIAAHGWIQNLAAPWPSITDRLTRSVADVVNEAAVHERGAVNIRDVARLRGDVHRIAQAILRRDLGRIQLPMDPSTRAVDVYGDAGYRACLVVRESDGLIRFLSSVIRYIEPLLSRSERWIAEPLIAVICGDEARGVLEEHSRLLRQMRVQASTTGVEEFLSTMRGEAGVLWVPQRPFVAEDHGKAREQNLIRTALELCGLCLLGRGNEQPFDRILALVELLLAWSSASQHPGTDGLFMNELRSQTVFLPSVSS